MFNSSKLSTQESPYRLHYHVPSTSTQLTSQGGYRRISCDRVADLITFLAVTQRMSIDITFITWKAPLGPSNKLYGSLGVGGTAEVQQRTLHLQRSLAFKRPKPVKVYEQHEQVPGETQDSRDTFDGEYRNLISEITVLCHEGIRFHPNIITLEAVCWDFDKQTDVVWPVLIFEKANEGDLATFMNTTQGRSLNNCKRLELCQDVATAMLCLHRFGIIHGDINPRNLLVFHEKDDYYVKMSDFGYAAVMREEDHIDMARTWPWYAPEIDKQWSFDFEDARRTDYYSFGMVCAFILLHDDIGTQPSPQADSRNSAVSCIENLRRHGTFLHRVLELVQSLEDIDLEQRQQLKTFFEYALEEDPVKRILYLKGLFFIHAKRTDIGTVTFEEITPSLYKRDRLPWSAFFRVAKIWPHAVIGDFRLCRAIFNALKIQAKSHPDEHCRNNAALQVAICFELGFGCLRSTQSSEQWLKRSSGTIETLQDEIRSLEDPQYGIEPGRDVQNWGTTDPVPAYAADGLLQEAEKVHRRAMSDFEGIFSERHPMALKQGIIISDVLVELSRWSEAYDLISATLDKCRNSEAFQIPLAEAMETKRSICTELCRWDDADALLSEIKERGKNLGWYQMLTSRPFDELQQLGISQLHAQDYVAAEKTFLEFSEAATLYYGPESDRAIESRANLAILYVVSQNPKEGIYLQEVLDSCERNDTAYTRAEKLRLRRLLCRRCATHQELDKVFPLALRNLDDCRRQLGVYNRYTLDATEQLAVIYRLRGQRTEAQALLESLVAVSKIVYGERQPATCFWELELAMSLWADVRWDEALNIAERAISVLSEASGERHPMVVPWQKELDEWQKYKRGWELVGWIIPIGIIKIVGRQLNNIVAWRTRRSHKHV